MSENPEGGKLILMDQYRAAESRLGDKGSVKLGREDQFPDLVNESLERLRHQTGLEDLFNFQSVVGQAQQGHGVFKGVVYPNKRLIDVVRAAKDLRVHDMLVGRQRIVTQIEQWIDKALDYCIAEELGKRTKKPKGLNTLKVGRHNLINPNLLGRKFAPKSVLEGLTVGGFVDVGKVREDTIDHYEGRTTSGRDLVIGNGDFYFINVDKYVKDFGNKSFLKLAEHSDDMIDVLESLGLLSKTKRNGFDYQFVRRRHGLGVCDDLMLILTGVTYLGRGRTEARSAMAGTFLADKIDTVDKFLLYPAPEGWDTRLAGYVQDTWREETGQDLVPYETIMRVTYHSAKANDPVVNTSSSHRYFIQERGHGKEAMSTLRSHHNFVLGGPLSRHKVGFSGIPAPQFYNKATKRRRAMRNELKHVA
jgi:hypothetical protein